MAAVAYCPKCNVSVDPRKDRCPSCGSPVRYRFGKPAREVAKARNSQQREAGRYIRPPASK